MRSRAAVNRSRGAFDSYEAWRAVQARFFQLVGKDDASDDSAGRNFDVERIAFDFRGDWTGKRQRGFGVKLTRREDKRRTARTLRLSGLGIESKPNEVARGGDAGWSYPCSFAAGWPQSVRPCRFAGVI